jgi:DNA-binding NtrC family response regulator
MIQSQRPRVTDATTIEANDASTGPATPCASSMWLVITGGAEARTIELPDGANLTLGRAEGVDIVVSDPSLSRKHASFNRNGEQLVVSDLTSRNGTWLAGERIGSANLRAGSTVVVGSISVSVQITPPTALAMLGLLGTADLLELLEDECARSRLFARPLSVLLVAALAPAKSSAGELAQRIGKSLRPTDCAAPYVDRTLLIALPETNAETALRLAEQFAAVRGNGPALACGIASLAEAGPDAPQLVAAATRALARCTATAPCLVAEPAAPSARRRSENSAPERLGIPPRNPATRELERMIARLAPRRISVLVLGETGTGKELVARELHRGSERSAGPLKVVNCAAIPENLIESVLFGHVKGAFTGADRDRPGLFAQAHGGTLFLDEVGELSAGAQAALLRVLDTRRICPVGGCQELEVDVRVVAATHRDLASMAEDGTFRLDLFHRLNSVTLRVPPLRERRDEIEALLAHFVAELSDPQRSAAHFLPIALERLCAYAWPGNVRELRNVVERALALADTDALGLESLPREIAEPAEALSGERATGPDSHGTPDEKLALRPSLEAQEIALIREALRRCDGNQRRAATLLQLPLRTLERKLRIFGPRAKL